MFMRRIKVGHRSFRPEMVTSTGDHPDREEFIVVLGADSLMFRGREARLVRAYFAKQLVTDLEAELGDKIDPAPVMLHPDTWKHANTPEYAGDAKSWPGKGTPESAENGPRCTCPSTGAGRHYTGSGHVAGCPVEEASKARGEAVVRELFEEEARRKATPLVPAWATPSGGDGCGEPTGVHSDVHGRGDC